MKLSKLVKNLTGRRFGRLKVIEYAGTNGEQKALWRCVCDCGTEVTVIGTRLSEGRRTSCRCAKANPAVRQAARWKTPPERRVEIAKLGNEAARALRAIPSEVRSETSRKNGKSGGRPLSASERCACGEMTAKRAKARGHRCS